MKVLILNTDDCKFFTLFSTPHFTDNVEIAQTFTDLRDAQLCAEQYLDSGEYEGFDDVFYELVIPLLLDNGDTGYVNDRVEKVFYNGSDYTLFEDQDGKYSFKVDGVLIHILEADNV